MSNTRQVFWGAVAGLLTLTMPASVFGTPLIVTRMVTPAGSANTATVTPGGAATFEVRIDSPTVSPIGAAYRLTQTAPLSTGYLSISGRTEAGSLFNDPQGGESDASVTSSPGNLLGPDNSVNVGNNSAGLVGVSPANDILVTTATVHTSLATPPGTYRIQPTPGVSFVTEVTTAAAGNDISMSDAYFDIVVVPLTSCTYAVTPSDLSNAMAAGGFANVTVSAPSGCPVAANSFQSWVSVNSITPNGGTTTVALTISANAGAARSTSIVLADRLFLITQSGP
ncbi:MAG: hypothetical protein ABI039_13930 [Vicinamibacterales bacterium]